MSWNTEILYTAGWWVKDKSKMGLCVSSLPISLMMTARIYTLSYYHHQIGSMNYYPLFRVRSWNNGMRCMSLYILMVKVFYWTPRGVQPQISPKNTWTQMVNYHTKYVCTAFRCSISSVLAMEFQQLNVQSLILSLGHGSAYISEWNIAEF